MSIAEEMRSRLQDAFEPSHLEIIDDSESHRGHAGFRDCPRNCRRRATAKSATEGNERPREGQPER